MESKVKAQTFQLRRELWSCLLTVRITHFYIRLFGLKVKDSRADVAVVIRLFIKAFSSRFSGYFGKIPKTKVSNLPGAPSFFGLLFKEQVFTSHPQTFELIYFHPGANLTTWLKTAPCAVLI